VTAGRALEAVTRAGAAVWRWPFARRPAARATSGRASADARSVRLLDAPPRLPATDAERHAVAILRRAGALPAAELRDRLARALYRDLVRQAGSTTEVGVLGTALFRAEAGRALAGGDGILWASDAAPAAGSARGAPR